MSTIEKIKCKFCARGFTNDQRLIAHVCEQKRRHTDKNTVASRIAFYTYSEIFKLTTRGSKAKSFNDFATSNLYKPLIKFSRAVIMLEPINLEEYVHYLITSGVKMKEWNEDETYLAFVVKYLMLEPPLVAFERTFRFISKWSAEHNIEYNLFFKRVTTSEATSLIQSGKLSPWVIYLAGSSIELLALFNAEQAKLIADVLDPAFWEDRMAARDEDRTFIRNTLTGIGF